MRVAFIETLVELARQDPRILLLTGDLGYLVVEPFVDSFPDRFINVGVAEQNMIGIATGLAEAGFIPFVYSITPFAVLRPFEFIRNGPIYHQLPVRIVGVGQGVEYGVNGNTHFGMEDVGVLRTQPGIAIIAPADDTQTRAAVKSTCYLPGPVYYRLSKDSFEIPELNGRFLLGQTQKIGQGKDVLLISSGALTREVVKAAQMLFDEGVSATILIVASIAPVPESDLVDALLSFRHVVTVEAHYVVGGVGSMVVEVAAKHHLSSRIVRLGFDEMLNASLGAAAYFHNQQGLSAEKLASLILQELENG